MNRAPWRTLHFQCRIASGRPDLTASNLNWTLIYRKTFTITRNVRGWHQQMQQIYMNNSDWRSFKRLQQEATVHFRSWKVRPKSSQFVYEILNWSIFVLPSKLSRFWYSKTQHISYKSRWIFILRRQGDHHKKMHFIWPW